MEDVNCTVLTKIYGASCSGVAARAVINVIGRTCTIGALDNTDSTQTRPCVHRSSSSWIQ